MGDDAFDDLHQVGVVAKTDIGFLKLAVTFDVNGRMVIHEDIGDFRIVH